MYKHKNILALFNIILIAIIVFSMVGQQPVSAKENRQSINTNKQRAIKDALKKQNANAIVLVSNEKRVNKPVIISNQIKEGLNTAEPVRSNKLFPIASYQKSVTGLAVQQLINQHKLSLSTKVSKYLPEVPNANNITIKNLLTHTSGLADASRMQTKPLTTEKQEVNFTLHNSKIHNRIGQWHYANVNYGLLAIIISKVTHQSYHKYIAKHVFKVYGINSVKFYTQLKSNKDVTKSIGRTFNKDPYEKSPWNYLKREMSTEYGAGEIFMSPRDYWKFIYRAVIANNKVISQYQKMKFANSDTPYYAGFYLHPNEIHANGSYDGYACTFFTNTKSKKTIMLFSNNINLKQSRELGYSIYHIYFGQNKQGFAY